MPDIGDLLDLVERRFLTLPGLRAVQGVPRSVTPPVAVIGWPEVLYDLTMVRASDTLQLEPILVVSNAAERGARARLLAYIGQTGPTSVKAALDGPFGQDDVPGAEGFVHVRRAAPATELVFDSATYWGCTFNVEVVVSWTS